MKSNYEFGAIRVKTVKNKDAKQPPYKEICIK